MWKNTGQRRPAFACEPQAGQESVWDYPRPPVMVEDNREVIVATATCRIARSFKSIRILETASPPTFYLPREDCALHTLRPSAGRTYCEWKGAAQYFALVDDPAETPVAWCYPAPSSPFARIAGWLSFYPARVPCFVDGQPVQAQAGGFYGGWITPEIVGPFKGDPGTAGW